MSPGVMFFFLNSWYRLEMMYRNRWRLMVMKWSSSWIQMISEFSFRCGSWVKMSAARLCTGGGGRCFDAVMRMSNSFFVFMVFCCSPVFVGC